MSAAVAPTHTIHLIDGSVLTIGQVAGGFTVLSCDPGTTLGAAIEAHRQALPVSRVPERMRLLGPHPGDRYIPTDNSPIEIRLVGDGNEVTLFSGLTTETARVSHQAPR